jgi:hypothetical protein
VGNIVDMGRDLGHLLLDVVPHEISDDYTEYDQRRIQRQELNEDDLLQKKQEDGVFKSKNISNDLSNGGQVSSSIETRINKTTDGKPIPYIMRQAMEKAFGADFSDVRIHDNAEANELSKSLQARAFTNSNKIFFRAGEYDENSSKGQELLAHELTHIVQQNSHNIQRQKLDEDEKIESLGWRPEEQLGPYLHASEIDNRWLQVGAGLLHKEFDHGAGIDVMTSNLDFGVFGNIGENARLGGRANAQMFKGVTSDNQSFGFDGSVFSAESEMSGGEDGATIGASASVIQGGARIGNITSEEMNDEQFRAGLGFGTGASARFHSSDQDQDGRREWGIGADFGPLTFDLKSEDPILTAAKYLMPLSGWATDFLTDDKEFNLTESLLKFLPFD